MNSCRHCVRWGHDERCRFDVIIRTECITDDLDGLNEDL